MTLEKALERIDSLEITVSEQQQVIDDLSEMVTKQWDAHEALKRELSKVTEQVRELEDGQPGPTHQKAPHY